MANTSDTSNTSNTSNSTDEIYQGTGRRVSVGDHAPDFTLPDQSGKPVRLSDLLGERAVVLYFYPKDETGGCTAEACSFRDSYEVFKDAGAEVVGVSSDTVESHQSFATHHRLPFVLLSDADGALASAMVCRPHWGCGRAASPISSTGRASSSTSSRHNSSSTGM